MLKHEIKKTVLVVSVLLFILFYFGGQASAQTISITSMVQDINKNPITDATITAITTGGGVPITPTYDSSGNFTITGLPSGTPFWLRFHKNGYRSTSTGNYNSTTNIVTYGPYTLYADTDTLWGLQMGKGVIIGRAFAELSPQIGYVNGVVLTATASKTPGKTYPVTYFDDNGPIGGDTSTTTNGRFMVLNVDDMDTVTVTGTKTGWTGFQRTYKIFANSVSDGRIIGSTSSTISYTGAVKDGTLQTPTPLSGVTIELVGNSSINTTSDNNNGNFTLGRLPPDTTLQLKLSKVDFIPTFTANMSFTGDSTSPGTYSLFTQQTVTNWGVTSGKGVIASRVIDNANPQSANVGGAVVTFTSTKYPSAAPYLVKYRDDAGTFGGTSTDSNGRYYIFNVEEGDTVTVTAFKNGWSFNTRKFITRANAVSQGLITGTQAAGGQQTITFTGKVQDINKNPITDATITAITTGGAISIDPPTYDSSGNFTLNGLPSGTPFWLRFSKYGYRGTSTGSHNSTLNIDATGGPYTLYTDSDIASWGLELGKGVIVGRIFAQTSPSIGYVKGVALTATSGNTSGKTYPVLYFNDSGPIIGGTSTTTNGRFMVLNVDDMDTVTVTGTKTNWTGFQRVYKIFANSVSEGRIYGSTSSTISYTGAVKEGTLQTPTPLSGVTIELVGNSSINTTSDNNGNFTLGRLPPDTTLQLKLSKVGFIPTFTANMGFTGDSTSPGTYSLFTQQTVTNWGVTSGKGVIASRVIDNANPQSANVGGAVVTFTSTKYPSAAPYQVKYRDDAGTFGGVSTDSNGRYYIFNVEEGDTVTVTAFKNGWSFNTRKFITRADAVSQGLITGTTGEQGGGGGGDITSISLSQGWNFVSFPKQPANTAIETVLADVLSGVRIVWGYDNVNKVWLKYRPNAQNQTLNTLEAGKGYWIYMNEAGTIDLATWTAASKTVSLSEGWNLVGYSGTNEANISISGRWIFIWNWVSGQWSAKTADSSNTLLVPQFSTLNQGKAYWIKMGSATDWTQ